MALTRTPLVVLAMLVAAACGTDATPSGTTATGTTGHTSPPGTTEAPKTTPALELSEKTSLDDFSMDDPPEFHFLTDSGDQLDVDPWSYCLPWACVDGAHPDPVPEVGSPDVLEFGFDIPGWEFSWVTFREHGTRGEDLTCAREIRVEAISTGDRTFRIEPAGPAGDWDVDIFGRGPDGGDVIATVRWQTPVDGTFPERATGQAAVLADHDGELDSYGVELSVTDLDRDYPDATARITVTSAEGRSVTIPLRPHLRPCYSEGSLWFTARPADGRKATTLGEGPFTYTAEVVLDGTTYTGMGTWPDDTNEEITPGIPLTDWRPALPAYDGK